MRMYNRRTPPPSHNSGMSTIAAILKQLPRTTGDWNSDPWLPDSPLPVVVIANGDAPASQITAHVICADLQTAGVILVPHQWATPPGPDFQRLWAPPDPLGWRITDVMEQADVERVQFWNRARSVDELTLCD